MRLIDADGLFKAFENTAWYNNADRDDVAEELLLDAPTIDAEPVRHGHWVAYEDETMICATEFVCSACRESFVSSELTDKEFYEMMNYCPNCGAKMGEVSE